MDETDLTGPRSEDAFGDILVAVGGSDYSFTALEHATRLATATDAVLRILIVEEVMISSALLLAEGEMLTRFAEEVERVAQHVAGIAEQRALEIVGRHDVGFEIMRRPGEVLEQMIEASQDVSLIMAGKKGHRDEHQGLLGSNTERLVRVTRKAVFLAPASYIPIRQVRIAHGPRDPSPAIALAGLAIARSLAVPAEIVTVTGEREEYEKAWRVLEAAATGHDVRHVQREGSLAEEILRDADQATLIVIGAYNHARLYQRLVGSTAEEIMRTSPGPLLLVGKPR